MPSTAVIGVLISCDIAARNSVFARLAASAAFSAETSVSATTTASGRPAPFPCSPHGLTPPPTARSGRRRRSPPLPPPLPQQRRLDRRHRRRELGREQLVRHPPDHLGRAPAV